MPEWVPMLFAHLIRIEDRENRIMADLSALQVAVAALQQRVTTDLANLNAQIASLEAGATSQSDIDAVTAAVNAIDPAPAPTDAAAPVS